MFLKRSSPLLFFRLLLILIISSPGCSLLKNQNKLDERMKEVTQKKQNYNNLRRDLSQSNVAIGTSTDSLKERYGDPDDIFHSGSMVSNFEIWTYEKIYAKGEEGTWQRIRLYFDNNKLVSWDY